MFLLHLVFLFCLTEKNVMLVLIQPCLNGLGAIKRLYDLTNAELMNFVKCVREDCSQSWIDSEENFSDEEFEPLTSLTKAQLHDLYAHCHPL